MCAHFAPDFRFLPPSPSPEDRAPDPPGFQIFRREVEVGGSPGDDGPRAAGVPRLAVCFKTPLVICYAVEDC